MDKAERRQQLLRIARDVFAQRGYHAAKIDDIVAAANVARGTFYLYFDDKRAIFEEIVDGAFERIAASALRVDPEDTSRSVGDQVRENVSRFVGALMEDRATTKILLSDAVGLDPAFDKKLLAFYEGLQQFLEESLRDGQALGVVAPGDTRLLTLFTLGMMKEIFYQVTMRGLELDRRTIEEEVFRFLRAGYLRV